MVSYMSTPLFPIQEAINSATSLPTPVSFNQHRIVSNGEEDTKLQTILNNYKQSERDYLTELKTLASIAKNFDPVYNNYYDGSLDDITDEMVDERKEKNSAFKQLIAKITTKHTDIALILKQTEIDAILINLVSWTTDVTELYTEYVNFYKLDITQCKTEIKIRRRPLIRIRYLNNFFKSLKEIVEGRTEPYCGLVLNSFEDFTMKLTQTLEQSREVDELQKTECKNEIYTTNAKDIVSLQPVCVDVRQHHLDVEYQCDVHYVNKKNSAKLDVSNVSVVVLKNTNIKQLVILRKDNCGKHILFAPLKKNEFTYSNDAENNANTLKFVHSVLNDQVEITFTFNEHTSPELSAVLLNYFPQYVPSSTYNVPTFGLGFKIGNDVQEIENARSEIAPIEETVETDTTTESSNCTDVESIDTTIEFTNQTKTINETPLYLKFANNDNLPVSQATSNHPYNLISAPTQSTRETNLSKMFLNQVANDESSDDEAESIISEVSTTIGLNVAPIQQTSTPMEQRVETLTRQEVVEPVEESNNGMKYKKINIEKYQHSIGVEQKPKKKSFFGSFAGLLSRKNNKQSVKQQTENVESKPVKLENSLPTQSLQSLSSVLSLQKDNAIECILEGSISKHLPDATVALWNAAAWTKSKDMKLVLHTTIDSKFYLGCYDQSLDECFNTPMILLELTADSDCMFNTIDIHLKTKNHKGNSVTVLVRPIDRANMNVIGNALVNPELFETVINNSESVSSDLSGNTVMSTETRASSVDACDGEYETKNVESVKVEGRKTWTGVGDLKLIMNSKKQEDLNRCVVSVTKKEELVTIDLTGFDFGNIELDVNSNQIKLVETTDVLINGKDQGVYLLSLDSINDINNFHECVY